MTKAKELMNLIESDLIDINRGKGKQKITPRGEEELDIRDSLLLVAEIIRFIDKVDTLSDRELQRLGKSKKDLLSIKELHILSTRLPHKLVNPINLSPGAIPIVSPNVWPAYKEAMEKIKMYDTLGIL